MTPILTDKVLGGFLDLFEDIRFVEAVRARLGNVIYPHETGWYPLTGLPGSVRIKERSALFVKPWSVVIEAATPHMTNNAIGGFRAIQSAHWRKQGLLPVFVTDAHHIASPLLAFVPFTEHEKFNRRKT